ncbi:MAG TPA: cation:proton antiporter, partial [Candidatus Nitrosotalea sp.]|nr:cation:proton antiporter [Candidatus Nitrosotalea sp.]
VALLLFTVGLEFSLERLARMKQTALGGGSLQLGITVLLTMGVLLGAGLKTGESLFWGFLVAVSSTAIVMKVLEERNEVETMPGRISLGILLFQDLCVVPMMALVPVLAARESAQVLQVLIALGKSLLVVAMIVASARYIFPRLLRAVAGVRSREVFVIATLFATLATAWGASQLGLSLALGAFIAGVVISESEYAHQAMAAIIPFRDSFSSLFFVAIGMLIRVPDVVKHAPVVLGVTMALLLTKVMAGTAAVRILGFPARLAVVCGLAVAQVGEFSFVLLREGERQGMVPESFYQVFLSAAVLTLAATPGLLAAGPRVARWFSRQSAFPGEAMPEDSEKPMTDHIIICGYGENGRRLATLLRDNNLPYVIVDVNAIAVRKAKAAGERIYFGDLSSPEILRRAGVEQASAVVFAVSDPAILPLAISHARVLNPDIQIIARVKRIAFAAELRKVGATHVVAEEIEAWTEIALRVLRIFGVPREVIAHQLGELRAGDYDMQRILPLPGEPVQNLWHLLPEVDLELFIVMPGSRLAGMELREVDLRGKSGTVVVAVVRDPSVIYNPGPGTVLAEADQLVLIGARTQLAAAHEALNEIQLGAPDAPSTPPLIS